MRIAQKKAKPLEHNQRLSRSLLWKLQRNFFDNVGINAWRTETVPHYITCCPSIADTYSKVVLGYLRDCQSIFQQPENTLADLSGKDRPFYIVELGSGSGRFGFLFLKRFQSLCKQAGLGEIPVKYVMTDFTEKNLHYWQNHKWLKPYVEEGILDFALFDVEHSQNLKLVVCGDSLSAETARGPIAVIANYLFDSIPQDAFSIQDGRLYESLITVCTPQKELDLNDPAILNRVEIEYSSRIAEGNYYDDALWNGILQDYTGRLTATSFLFPTAALSCIKNLCRISGGRMLLLAADKGYSRDEDLYQGQGSPFVLVHGSFSMNVDFRIIGKYVRQLGGQTLYSAHPPKTLTVSAFLLGDLPNDHRETKFAFERAVEEFGPDDLFIIRTGIERIYDSLTLDQIMAFLRLIFWDHKKFMECLPTLKQRLEGSSGGQKKELRDAILRIWDAYMPIGEEEDIAFHLGTVLVEIDYYSEALEFFQHSVELFGMEPGTAYNIAVCYFSLENMQLALQYSRKALDLDGEFEAARELYINVQSVMESTRH